MGQKIQIIKAEKFNWYKVGDILELAPEQKHVTLGVQVIKPEGEISDIVIHGNYKDYIEVELDTTTEELIFTIVVQPSADTILTSFLEQFSSSAEQFKVKNQTPLEWIIEEKCLLTAECTEQKIYTCQTIKDSHINFSTTNWTQSCIDFVCLLQQNLSDAKIKAYTNPIQLYSFLKK